MEYVPQGIILAALRFDNTISFFYQPSVVLLKRQALSAPSRYRLVDDMMEILVFLCLCHVKNTCTK